MNRKQSRVGNESNGNSKPKKIGKQWTHKLCQCCDDCGECLTMCCMPCCYMPIVAMRAGETPVVFCCGCAHSLRTKVREERKIEVIFAFNVF